MTTVSSPAAIEDFRSLRDLYTPRQVAGLLQRERARADRHAREFSLVVIRLRTGDGEWTVLRLARLCLDAARTTDEVGRYDDDAIACILPDTDAAGAWYFARRTCAAAKAKGLDPICMVYAYPSAWTPGEEEGGNSSRSEVLRRHNPRNAPLHMADYETPMQDTIPPSDDFPIESLSQLFVKRTPFWKRVVDFIAAGMGIVVLSPVLLVVALAIKMTDPKGPVIFKQKRAGIGGRPFQIYKFRTMRADAEAMKAQLAKLNEQDGPAFKITNDPRVTRIGHFLRKTSLDELPQLFNVLKGDMSIVGPRPLPVSEADACDPWHKRRLDVAPGLTCIWQVHGRSRVTFDEWARMDIRYIKRRKLWHDITLILQTIPAVLLRRGAK
ncbi:MAG TPA: sugar transferase [Tepidisphaeraceae bacterium]|nr:sugar transferase [Tepidisphaeraceae bacterium]